MSVAGRPAGTVFRDCAECPEMVAPAGRFRMGCVSGRDCRDRDQEPVHAVTVGSFALSKYEVTFEGVRSLHVPEPGA